MGSGYGDISSSVRLAVGRHSLVVFRDATLAPAAMLAPKRRSDHARNTEVGVVEFPKSDEFVNHGLLLSDAVQFGHKTWVVTHTPDVKPGAEREGDGKRKIREPSSVCPAVSMPAKPCRGSIAHTWASRCVSKNGKYPVHADQEQ